MWWRRTRSGREPAQPASAQQLLAQRPHALLAQQEGPALGRRIRSEECKRRVAVIAPSRLLVGLMLEAAQHEAGAPHRPPRDGPRDPRQLGRKMDVDRRRPVFRRGPAAKFLAGAFEDLETGKDVVVNVGPEGKVELGLTRELMDFRPTEGRHAASVPKVAPYHYVCRRGKRFCHRKFAVRGGISQAERE